MYTSVYDVHLINKVLTMRYTPRYPFRAEAEIIDLESGLRLSALASDLSLFGCGLDACRGFRQGAGVRIQLRYDGMEIVVLGRVVYARPDLGMGVAFTTVEARAERILCGWIAKLTSQHASV